MANNLNVSINLLKMKAAVMGIKGKESVKKCVVIPIEDNDLFSKVGDDGSVSVYLNLTCWENQTPSQFGDTHMVKQSHSKEWNEAHTAEQKREEPILGNARPVVERTIEQVNVPTAEAVQGSVQTSNGGDDLPFKFRGVAA